MAYNPADLALLWKHTAAVPSSVKSFYKKGQEVVKVQRFMATTSQSIAWPVRMMDVSSERLLLATCGLLCWDDVSEGAGINQSK